MSSNDYCELSIADKNTFNELALLVDNDVFRREQSKLRGILGFTRFLTKQEYTQWKKRHKFLRITDLKFKEFSDWFNQVEVKSLSKTIDPIDTLNWHRSDVEKNNEIYSLSTALTDGAIRLCDLFKKDGFLYNAVEIAIATNKITEEDCKLAFVSLFAPNIYPGNLTTLPYKDRSLFLFPSEVSIAIYARAFVPKKTLKLLIKNEISRIEKEIEKMSPYRNWSFYHRKDKVDECRILYWQFKRVKEKNPLYSKEKSYLELAREDMKNKMIDQDKTLANGASLVKTAQERIKEAIETYEELLHHQFDLIKA